MSVLRSVAQMALGDTCRNRLPQAQMVLAINLHLLNVGFRASIKWLASLTLGEIARALGIAVLATVLIPSALLVFVVWYVPIIIGALLYNRTFARLLGRRAFKPFW